MSEWSGRCAACKYLRRKCPQDCVLAPYFPSNDPQRFSAVHKIFGSSNIAKMLQKLPEHLRMEAADCMAMEAHCRIEDPVYGCVSFIDQLQQQIIETQSITNQINAQIAFYNAHNNHPFSSSFDQTDLA
ncbi:hypothetical protein QYF36_006692 [Acer negundo]|nr:hypothetical protein QYF36_006692 [Acer negundo]